MPKSETDAVVIEELVGAPLMTQKDIQKQIAFWKGIERHYFGQQQTSKVRVQSGPFHVKFY